MVDPFLADITRIALAVARRYGFALGGGNALVLYGLVDRPTADVDLFTDRDEAVRAVVGAVLAALSAAGLTAVEVRGDGDLVAGLDDLVVDIDVVRGDHAARLSLACQARSRRPTAMAIGPVVHLDDLLAWKVAAIINRREVRDYVDTAAFLGEHAVAEVIAAARTVDPDLADEDVVMVGRVLDEMPDSAFARYGVAPAAVADLRARFAAWPR